MRSIILLHCALGAVEAQRIEWTSAFQFHTDWLKYSGFPTRGFLYTEGAHADIGGRDCPVCVRGSSVSSFRVVFATVARPLAYPLSNVDCSTEGCPTPAAVASQLLHHAVPLSYSQNCVIRWIRGDLPCTYNLYSGNRCILIREGLLIWADHGKNRQI